MRIAADTHCHTIASTHAYSTLMELITEAKRMDLCALAVTDHGGAMPGCPGKWYFDNLTCVPPVVDGVRVLRGIEANVVDYEGKLDFCDPSPKNLEWVIASMHEATLPGPRDEEMCTNAWLQVAQNPQVRVIGHCGMQSFRFDYQRVIPEFGRQGKLVEINNNSFRVRKSAVENCREIALLCKRHAVPVVVNSDAHFCTQVGKAEQALQMLEEIGFPESLIVNSSRERFMEYLKQCGL
ncbi:MAG: phosphatase [Clostridiales bacterium]|jgi:putative hydrolase|nr:phosphatase [Clostridiales bacterium]